MNFMLKVDRISIVWLNKRLHNYYANRAKSIFDQ